MRVIYKYPLNDLSRVAQTWFEMPEGSKFCAAAMQNGRVTTWFEGEQDAPRKRVLLQVFGTGHTVPYDENGKGWVYRATVFDDPFVWHVYEQVDVV